MFRIFPKKYPQRVIPTPILTPVLTAACDFRSLHADGVTCNVTSICVAIRSVAKHKGRRQALAVINVNENVTLGTLASGVVISQATDQFEREFFAISCDLNWSMSGFTGAEGPLEVGVAHGDYTVTEIKENLDLTGMEDPSDKITQEQGRRLVRRSGKFRGQLSNEQINDGKPVRTRLRFMLAGSVATLQFFVHNLNASALTTGAIVQIDGKIYGRWA